MLKKAVGFICVLGVLVSLVACGTKEVTPETKPENGKVEQKVNETNPTEPASNNVVTDLPNEPSGGENSTPDTKDVNVVDEKPLQPENNGPVTMDSCLGTYKSDTGDSFTFEKTSDGKYIFKNFVFNGETVENGQYPLFLGDNYAKEKEDGSLEVMTSVQDDLTPYGYILLFKKDGTLEVTKMSATVGPLGSIVVFSKQ